MARLLALLWLALAAALAIPPGGALAQDRQSAAELSAEVRDDQGFLTRLLEQNLSGAGREVQIHGFRGALSSRATFERITIADADGIWIELDNGAIQWNRSALFARRIEIAELSAETIRLPRLPAAGEGDRKAEVRSFSLPTLPVAVEIDRIAAGRVEIGEPVFGEAAVVSLAGSMGLKGGAGEAQLAIERVDGKRGIFTVDAAYSNATKVLKTDITLDEEARGIFANLVGLEGRPAVRAEIAGEGPLDDFAAEIALATDGQPRVTGQVAIAAAAGEDGSPGRSFRLRLGGDVAALIPEAQRAFFGREAQLLAEGWRGDDGRLSVPVLLVDTEALNLSGSLTTNAENAPLSAVLLLTLGADAGAAELPVRLPLRGPATTVRSGRLQLSYDAAQGSGWTLRGHLDGFAREGFALGSVDLDGEGAVRLEGESLAQVTGAISFDAAGIAPADPALAEAVGPKLSGNTSFDWTPGNVVEFTDLAVASDFYGLEGELRVDGLGSGITVSGEVDARHSELARLSGLAGRPMQGQADGHLSGYYILLTKGFDAEGRFATTDLTIGQEQLDRLLSGDTVVTASARRDETGIELRDLTIAGERLTAAAEGVVSSEASDLRARLTLASLAEVDPAMGGSLQAEAALSGPAGQRRLALNGQAVDLQTGIEALDGAMKGTTDLAVQVSETEGVYTLQSLRLENPQLTAEGQGNLTPGQIDARLTATLADLGNLMPGWAGSVEATGRIAEADGLRRLSLAGTGENLRFGQQDVDGALSGTTRFALEATQDPADGQIELQRLDLANDQLSASAQGPIGQARTDLTGSLSVRSLASLGRGWKGSLEAEGAFRDMGEGIRRLELTGTGQDLALGRQEVDGALTGTTRFALAATQGPEGFVIERGELRNDQIEVTAQGAVGRSGTDLTGAARVRTLAALGLGWDGSVDLEGSFRDDGSGARRLAVTGTTQDVRLGQPQLNGLLQGQSALTLTGTERDGVFTIESASLANPQARASASGTYGAGATDLAARIEMPSLAPLGPGWNGSLAAEGTLRETGDGIRRFAVTGTGTDLSFGQTQLDAALRGATRFEVAGTEQGGTVTLERAEIDNPRLSADATGRVGGGVTDIEGRIDAESLAFLGPNLQGGLTATGRVRQEGRALAITASGEARNLGIGNDRIDPLLRGSTSFDLAARRAGDDLAIERLSARNAQLTVTASGALSSGVTLEARLADLALLAPGFPGPAQASGTVRRAGGNFGLDLDVSAPGGTSASIEGSVAQDGSTADLRISGVSDAAIANPILRVRSVEGPVNFDLRLNGRPSLEALSGRVSLPNARLSDPKLGLRIEGLELTAELGGGAVEVTGGGGFADGGRIAVDGRIGLANPRPVTLTIRLDGATVRDPNLYETSATGTLSVSGTLAEGPLIAGRLALGRTEIRIPATGLGGARDIPEIRHLNDRPPVRATRAKAGLTPYPGAESAAAGLAGPPATPPTVVARLDVTLDAPNQVFVRGRGIDAELGGTIRLTGNARNVIPVGYLDLIRGRVDLLGKRFDLTEGLLELQGSMVPVIRLVAERQQEGIVTRINIEGEANDPTITFTSVPDMPQEEVLAQLLFGRGLDNISALQAAQLANAVATLAGRGGEGIVSRLRNTVGLDDLDLATDDEGNVTVRAGKYISDRVYTDVAVGGDGKTRLNINLDVTDSLTARGAVDNEGDSSLGLFFERDY